MSTFRRSGHYRTNKNGTRTWVSGHSVTRSSWNSGASSYRYSAPSTSYSPRPQPTPAPLSPQSLLVPNAKCPVCGASVYFYSNERGSRVYFDELGPPWPKHPCITATSWPPGSAGARPPAARLAPDAKAAKDPDAWRRMRAAEVIAIQHHKTAGAIVIVKQPGNDRKIAFQWLDTAIALPPVGAVVFERSERMSFVSDLVEVTKAPVRLIAGSMPSENSDERSDRNGAGLGCLVAAALFLLLLIVIASAD